MRTYIILISLVVSAFGVPVDDEHLLGSTREIDYEACGDKVAELREVALGCSDDNKKIALEDNAEIGQQIADTIDAECKKAKPVYDELETKIKAKALTAAEAKGCLEQLKAHYLYTQAVIKPHCIKLSKKAQDQINEVTDNAFKKCEEISKLIHELCKDDN